jgi:hypothetical protein
MSITFHPELHSSDVIGEQIICFDSDSGHTPGVTFPTRLAAIKAYRDGVDDGTMSSDCCAIVAMLSVDLDRCAVNLSNRNAADLLRMLGFVEADGGTPFHGTVDPEDLRGRILLARALAADDGTPAICDGRLLVAGRPPGYFTQAFTRLELLADECRKLGRSVVWA